MQSFLSRIAARKATHTILSLTFAANVGVPTTASSAESTPTSLSSNAPSNTGVTSSFANAVARIHPSPELIASNEEALDTRLRLIELAPPQSQIRIATFDFKTGSSTNRLASALCRAASRGVKVRLLVDSHSGSDLGLQEAFNLGEEQQTNQELYQLMANCGVEVTIFNSITSFIEVLGSRLPNFFFDKQHENQSVFALTANKRLAEIIDRFITVLDGVLVRNGVKTSSHDLVWNAKAFAFEVKGIKQFQKRNLLFKDQVQSMRDFGDRLQSMLARLLNDRIWNEVNAQQMIGIKNDLVAALRADSMMGPLLAEIRKFNRLNHKKLFEVETATGAGCLVIGGRNLADDYLTNKSLSFHDADALVCRHHASVGGRVFAQARASFESLYVGLADPHLNEEQSVRLAQVKQRPNYRYKLIADRKISKIEPISTTQTERKGVFAITRGSQFELVTSEWSRESDQIRQRMSEMIASERREIFIETPYAEFDLALRAELEGAAKRGVRVTVLTNGLYTADGGSKAIRYTMDSWFQEMQRLYPNAFFVLFTTPASQHMTHAKLAVFRDQTGNDGKSVRRYLIGSHNFHPRSSLSDREHAMIWEEPVTEDPLAKDLIDWRFVHYNTLKAQLNTPVLKRYMSIKEEMNDIEQLILSSDWELRHRTMIYQNVVKRTFLGSPEGPRTAPSYRRFLELKAKLETSGLSDVLGQFL